MLKKIIAEDAHEKLAVADVKLENVIQDKLDMNCVADSKIGEHMRCIRSQASGLHIRWDIELNTGSKSPFMNRTNLAPLPRFGLNGEKHKWESIPGSIVSAVGNYFSDKSILAVQCSLFILF